MKFELENPNEVARLKDQYIAQWSGRLEALGYVLVDVLYGHWSKLQQPKEYYFDLMQTEDEQWRGVRFRLDDTGSEWQSPLFPTPETAHVWCELDHWGLS